MFKELTEDNLTELLESSEKVMVQYGATWCGNCKITKPKFKRLADENESIEFYYVDAEKFPQSRSHADVSNLPTFAAFLNGKVVAQKQGNKLETIEDVLHAIAGH